MADRWEVRAAGPSSAPDHGGRAFARRGFAVALCAGLALASVRCFQDLIVEPSQPSLTFTITPESTDVAIGDTVAPFGGTLTANGQPVPFRLRLGVTQGANVVRADSLGRVAALARGVARLEARPLLSSFTSDTLRRVVTVRAIVYRLAVAATPSADTLTSLGDTLDLRAVALTRAGDTIPGVPIVWRRVSGDTAVTLLDSATGRVRAARNGEGEFAASVDTATAHRRVVVRQVPATVTTTDSLRLIALGQTASLADTVRDRRGNRVVGQAVAWASLDAAVASVSASGVVTAVANGSARIEGRVGALADTTRVVVAQVARALRRASGDGQSAQVGTALTAPFAVEMLDSLGAVVRRAGELVRFAVTSGGGKLAGQDLLDVASDANGGASATLTLPTGAGPQTVSARLLSLAASAVTFSATAVPATARTLALVSGDDQSGIVGAALAAPFVVVVQDTFGNAVAGHQVWFKVTRGGGKLGGQDSVVVGTNAQGQASATLSLGTVPDTNLVTATSAGLVGSPATFAAVAAAGPVRTLSLVSGGDQSGLVGAVLAEPFVVAAQDTFGNATAGRQIWFKVTRGGGKLGGLDSVVVATNAQGRASTTLTLGTVPDTNRVTATSTELVSAPVTFSAVAVARQAYQLVKVSGDSQMAQVGQPTADPFVVAVRDTFGNAVGGTVVVFRVVAGGGRFNGVDSLVDTTDAAGLATALLTVSGAEIDTTRIAASVEGLMGSPVAFLAASAPIPVAQVVVAPSGASVSGVGATFPFTAEARGASGSVLPGRTFAWASLNPNIATVNATSGVVTAVANGQVTIAATAQGGTGYGLVTVSTPGATPVNLWAPMVSGTTQNLYGLWGTSATDVYAVGTAGTVLRFDGTSWTAMSSGTTQVLEGIWGTSGVDIYAVGIGGAIRYSSGNWSAMTSSTTLENLMNVWGSSPSNVYAVGPYGTIVRFDGTTWTAVTSSTAQHLHGIWGTSSSDVFAVGDAGSVLHYDGSSWSAQASVTTRWLQAVWGASGSDVFAVSQNTFLRYNGTTWLNLVSGTTTLLTDVWGSSGSDVYAVGTSGAILRYDGASLSTMTSGTSQGLHSVWGTSSSDVFAVGEAGTILGGVRGATVTVTPPNPTLAPLGATVQLAAQARRASGDTLQGVGFTWSSSDPNVATVDANGRVTAVASGTATITATAPGGASGSATVAVSLSAYQQEARLSAGGLHTCALTADGAAYCWGGETDGQLGSGGNQGRRASPMAVSGSLVFQLISAGVSHTCGLTTEGAAYCWGDNSHGQLGDGTSRDMGTPLAVAGGLVFQKISAGPSHTCGLTTGGAAYCWGYNGSGQLGDGTTSDQSSPVAVSGGLVFQFISAGIQHTCGLTAAGAAYCWGYNGNGQLGDGTTGSHTSPVAVAGGHSFYALSVGDLHTCALTAGGVAYCWGSNDVGQLGDGTTADGWSPTAVSGGRVFQAVSAGPSHSCGLTTGGAAYCWGRNPRGQLGDGTTSDRTSPVAVTGGVTLQTLSAGSSHTCGLTTGGGAYCWGDNSYDQLGLGDPISRSSPVAVSGGLVFQAISAYGHTCGVTTGGAAYCWGGNGSGQLGDGTSGGTSNRTSPVAVLGGLVFQAIRAGGGHSCGLTAGGAAYCWGHNYEGQLGIGTYDYPASPVPVVGGLVFQALSAGFQNTCGVTTGGAAYCWGKNDKGQLGDGTATNQWTPVAVSGGLVFQSISTTGSHTCALTPGGAAYCWGENSYGQLGDGTTSDRSSPVAVLGGLVFQSISANGIHTCGLTAGGAAYCWGSGGNGQLGDGTASNRTSPVAVSRGLVFQAISAGAWHTCGITTGGVAYCWGSNGYGQLGDGTTGNDRWSPTAVGGGLTFQAINAGDYHTCGLTTGGAAYCWGSNGGGKLGDGTALRTTPVAVVGGVVFGAPAVAPAATAVPRLRPR